MMMMEDNNEVYLSFAAGVRNSNQIPCTHHIDLTIIKRLVNNMFANKNVITNKHTQGFVRNVCDLKS